MVVAAPRTGKLDNGNCGEALEREGKHLTAFCFQAEMSKVHFRFVVTPLYEVMVTLAPEQSSTRSMTWFTPPSQYSTTSLQNLFPHFCILISDWFFVFDDTYATPRKSNSAGLQMWFQEASGNKNMVEDTITTC